MGLGLGLGLGLVLPRWLAPAVASLNVVRARREGLRARGRLLLLCERERRATRRRPLILGRTPRRARLRRLRLRRNARLQWGGSERDE